MTFFAGKATVAAVQAAATSRHARGPPKVGNLVVTVATRRLAEPLTGACCAFLPGQGAAGSADELIEGVLIGGGGPEFHYLPVAHMENVRVRVYATG